MTKQEKFSCQNLMSSQLYIYIYIYMWLEGRRGKAKKDKLTTNHIQKVLAYKQFSNPTSIKGSVGKGRDGFGSNVIYSCCTEYQ